MPAPKLVLDFDGVICDALEECALVTWLGVHQPDPDTPVSAYLEAMPRGFLERFRKVRDFSRLLAHFIVAHRAAAANIQAKADFDRLFEAIPADYVTRFSAAASAARQRCRVEEADFWLDLHTLYDGVPELLRRHTGEVAVVTAKDADSVRAILTRHGLAMTVVEVIGECGRKAEAVTDLCTRHGHDPRSVTFIDDNLTNVLRVATTGARTLWATWGYSTPEDRAEAAGLGVRRLALEALPALAG
jgi:phosphoglycolate phosphatase-like HAD superfamily hydrolase